MIKQPGMLSLAIVATLTMVQPAFADSPRERAQAAQARGELRAAQIEWRNAVRAEPSQGALRAGLASASLDIGDTETGEREARAALEHGYDPAAGNSLLLRAYLAQGRYQDLLNQFPEPAAQTAPAEGAQVAAARALAQLALNDREAARASIALAERLGPDDVEPGLAAAALLLLDGDRNGAEMRVDRVLAAHPTAKDALMLKGGLQLDRSETAGSIESFGRIIAASPGDIAARLRRAEVLMRTGQTDRARTDIDAVLTATPGNATGVYLSAMLLTIQRDWRGADQLLQRLGSQLNGFRDGLLLVAMTKRGLGQGAQAEDAARRHVARYPDDPRGAKLLGTMELEADRPDAAVAVLTRAAANSPRDAELYDMLGRALTAVGKPAEAVQALERAVAILPQDPALLTRLAVSRLAVGDSAGSESAVNEALRNGPAQPGAREMLVTIALARGDLAAAEAELGRMEPAARRGEVASVLAGTLNLIRLDLPAARTEFETAVSQAPATRIGRIGLARTASLQGNDAEAEALIVDVLRRDPGNIEAIRRLADSARGDSPRAASALAALLAVQAANPGSPALALAAANLLAQRRDTDQAIAILEAEPLRRLRGPAIPIARAQVNAAASRWAPAEDAAREALAEDPGSVQARIQLARLRMQADDPRGSEAVLREGLRAMPGNAALQQVLVGLILEKQGADAALAEAARLAAQPNAMPAAAGLRGEVLMTAGRPLEAAQAFAVAMRTAPGGALAQRLSAAWRAAGRPDEAAAALKDRLEAAPDDLEALGVLAQLDLVAGRMTEAEDRLRQVIAHAPENAIALNNLAWVLSERGSPAALAEARGFALRAYHLAPGNETADTLGWILAQSGQPGLAVQLLRQAGSAEGTGYRLAFALNAAGQKEEAVRVLTPVLASAAPFPERARAERLRGELQR
ncbi:MAG: putative system TPR-repeat lipoprotein [Rubritepida sp.]|nr:putative system TPR-repeat lipoprotein [Rubritepida sp.]